MNTITTNKSGGDAFKMSAKNALAKLALTGTGSNICIVGSNVKNNELLALAKKVDPSFIAKLAIFAREEGLMRSAPVTLVAYLACNGHTEQFHKAFDRVVTNAKSVREFVRLMRSGEMGRKSLGSSSKRAVQRWFARQSPETLYWQSIGNSPTLGDVIKLAHPKPNSEAKNAMLAHLIGQKLPREFMPERIAKYEDFKADMSLDMPNVPFERLSSLGLTDEHWKQLAEQMTWNQLRKNLNTLQRHSVFESTHLTEHIAAKLSDPQKTPKHVMPYEMYGTFRALSHDVPETIREAVVEAIRNSLYNMPEFDHDVVVAVDVSSSMGKAVTTNRKGIQSSMSCSHAAAFFATGLHLRNPGKVSMITFNLEARSIQVPNRLEDSLVLLSRIHGGTRTASCIQLANKREFKAPLFIIISDNESWMRKGYSEPAWYTRWVSGSTGALRAWDEYRERVGKQSKLVCWDIAPNQTSQLPERSDILNVGGFSDSVAKLIKDFSTGQLNSQLVERVEAIQLEEG